MLPANAPAWIDRLLTWLEPFESAFGHVAQRGAFRRYLLGLLSDSPRKSMSAMLARVSDPGDYQAFQHFITVGAVGGRSASGGCCDGSCPRAKAC